MAAPAGFRFLLWSKLAAWFRQGADFFESKSRHEDVESPKPAGRLKGAPPHWLAMVQKRAPGFLSRLESGAGQAALLTGAKMRQHEQEESQASFDTTVEPSASEPALPTKKTTLPMERRPVEKSEGDESREVFGSDDAALLRNKTNESRQTTDFETVPRTDKSNRAHCQAGLRFETKKPASSSEVTQQAQSPRSDVFKLQPIVFAKKDDAVNQSISEQAQTTEPPIMKKTLPTKAARLRETFKISFHHDEQRPSPAKPVNSEEAAIHGSTHNDPIVRSAAQEIFPTEVHPAPSRDTDSDCRNAPTDGCWPDLSGLKKMPMQRDLWPELPEDAWSELWRNLAESTGTEHETKYSENRESSWNG